MEKEVSLLQNGNLLLTGHQADVREKIEEMIDEKFGFTPSLQEDAEEEYLVYLHTDTYDDLEEKEIEELDSHGITDEPESATNAIKKLFNVEFEIVGDWIIK